jgi:hypothetical protein
METIFTTFSVDCMTFEALFTKDFAIHHVEELSESSDWLPRVESDDSDDLRNVSMVRYIRPVIDEMLSRYTIPVVSGEIRTS